MTVATIHLLHTVPTHHYQSLTNAHHQMNELDSHEKLRTPAVCACVCVCVCVCMCVCVCVCVCVPGMEWLLYRVSCVLPCENIAPLPDSTSFTCVVGHTLSRVQPAVQPNNMLRVTQY